MSKKLVLIMVWSIVAMLFIAILFAAIGLPEIVPMCLVTALSIGITILILIFALRK